jgi:hypothetical protein
MENNLVTEKIRFQLIGGGKSFGNIKHFSDDEIETYNPSENEMQIHNTIYAIADSDGVDIYTPFKSKILY